MTKKQLTLCGLVLSLAAGNSFAVQPDRRQLDRPAEAVRLELPANTGETLRHRKPRLKGDFRVAGQGPRKAVQRAAASATPTIYANIIDYAPNDQVGIYKFTPDEYEFTAVVTDPSFAMFYGSAYYNGTFLGVDGTGRGYSWKTDDWSRLAGPVPATAVQGTAMAADPLDGTIYSCAYAADGITLELVTVNPETFTRNTTVSTVSAKIVALVFDAKGTLYAFESSGKLYTVDKSNGSLSYVGDTGIDAMFDGAAVIDPESGVCFYAATDWECGLYEVDLVTCESKLIMEFEDEEEIKCLFIIGAAPQGGSPAAAENLVADFRQGALSGSVSFTAPASTFDGNPGSGTLNYTLTCNDAELASGTCAWGETVSVDYTAPEAGNYSFVVTMSNQDGDSRPAAKSLWIGNDTPADPSNVKVERRDGTNHISWTAPAAGLHNGYVNFDEITYRVTRYPDNQVVAENVTGCEYADALADGAAPEQYHYTVAALWNGLESNAVSSNNVMVGAVYHNAFDNQAQFDEFMSVSLMKDGPVWSFDSWHKAASVGYNEEGSVSAWLISPALQLTAGQAYTLSFDVWCSNDSYTENLSVYLSNSDIPAEIYSTTPLVDKLSVNWESYSKKTITAEYTPEADGTYYLSFHGCSGRDLGSLYIDNVLLHRSVETAMPEAPEVSAQIMGGTLVMVTVTAPATDTDGNPLETIDRITVSRNGELIKTIEAPEAGEIYNFIDMLPGSAVYTYSAIAFTAAGRSAEGTCILSTAEAGKPRQPRITSVTETGDSGEITLEWEAPATDLNNEPIVPGTLTYAIYNAGDATPLVSGLEETKHTWQAVESGKQAFMSFYVVATNEAGNSEPSRETEPRPYGTPDTAPYAESFSGMEASHLWNYYNDDDYSEGHWLYISASETPEATPVDNDGGMLAFEGEFLDDTAWATTGKIDLGDGTSPKLSFWYFAVNAREGKDQLEVMVSDGSGYKRVDSFTMRDAQLDGWTKRTVDLSAYAGKTISLRFVGTSFRTGYFMLIDKIEITTFSKDAQAYALIAPASVLPGKEFKLVGAVVNNGSDINENFTAVLLRNGAEVAKENIYGLAAGATSVVNFTQQADASWNESVTYKMVVNLAGDEMLDNNSSEEVTVRVVPCTLPVVEDLKAVYTDEKLTDVQLSWTAPDASALAPAPYTENFEFYEAFEIDPVGDWTFIDGDGDNTYGSQSFPFEGMNDPKAFIVLDSDHFNMTYTAHSGTRFLASFSAISKQTDDWMISPELYGGAQTVSLYARSYTDMYGSERFEILASDSGTATTDFTVVKEFNTVPTEWTEFTADLPEGSKYFAIRCTSNNTFMFFVDDVTYIPAVNPASKYNILGFNVFANGERVNTVPVFGLTYNHRPASGSDPEYAVSVIYDHGESGLSKAVKPTFSGVEDVTADAISVRAVNGGIEITGTGTVTVITPDGKVVFTGNVEGTTFVPAIAGVYLAGPANNLAKIVVK